MDWADGRAREWMEHHMTGDDEGDYASLAALLREVYEQSHSETLVHCCVHRYEKAPYIEGCECVICHRQRVMAEVRRVVEGVRKETATGSGMLNEMLAANRACNEILCRLDEL